MDRWAEFTEPMGQILERFGCHYPSLLRKGQLMIRTVEKLLFSRRDTAEALSISIRSVDYLIQSGRLAVRRFGNKVLIPAHVVRQFATEDHLEPMHGLEMPGALLRRKPPLPQAYAEGQVSLRKTTEPSKMARVSRI